MKRSLYNINKVQTCPFSAYLDSLNLKCKEGKHLMLSKVIKYIIKYENGKFPTLKNEEIRALIEENIDESYFLTDMERKVETDTMFSYIVRYKNYLIENNYEILEINPKVDLILGNEIIKVKADIAYLINDNTVEVVRLRSGKTELSYKARSEKNNPENQIELFLLREAGKVLFRDKNIIASYHHMRGKSEDKEVLEKYINNKENELINSVLEFESLKYSSNKKQVKELEKEIKKIEDVLRYENTKGINIISLYGEKDLHGEVESLLNIELSIDSEKCISAKCENCDYEILCKYNPQKPIEFDEVVQTKSNNGAIKYTNNQLRLINADNGIFRVQACAGSGKTFTVTSRIKKLIEMGTAPNKLLMITFTEAGREEIISKLGKLGVKNLPDIYTFNGLGNKILEESYTKLGYTSIPKLISNVDSFELMKEVFKEFPNMKGFNYKNPLLKTKYVSGVFYQFKNMYEQYCMSPESFKDEYLLKMFNCYKNKIKKCNLIDYNTQLEVLLNDNKYSWEEIIIDESQDNNVLNYDIVKKMSQHIDNKTIMFVGDSNQSLYAFRGASPMDFIKLQDSYPEIKDINLFENFRSTKYICDFANKIIPSDLNMTTENEEGESIDIVETEKTEKYDIITNVIKNSKYQFEDIFFLSKTRKELKELSEVLNIHGIPNIIKVSEPYINNLSVKSIINLANYFLNNDLDYPLFENMMIRGVTENLDVVKSDINDILEDSTESDKMDLFYDFTLDIEKKDYVAKEFMDKLRDMSFETFNEMLKYLIKTLLYKDQTSLDKDLNKKHKAVLLMTIHASKGLEANEVIVSLDGFGDCDEESRRAFYVASTRAKKKLTIVYSDIKMKEMI